MTIYSNRKLIKVELQRTDETLDKVLKQLMKIKNVIDYYKHPELS